MSVEFKESKGAIAATAAPCRSAVPPQNGSCPARLLVEDCLENIFFKFQLPERLAFLSFSMDGVSDLAACAATCREWRRVAEKPLWEEVRRRSLPSLPPGENLKERCLERLNRIQRNLDAGHFTRTLIETIPDTTDYRPSVAEGSSRSLPVWRGERDTLFCTIKGGLVELREFKAPLGIVRSIDVSSHLLMMYSNCGDALLFEKFAPLIAYGKLIVYGRTLENRSQCVLCIWDLLNSSTAPVLRIEDPGFVAGRECYFKVVDRKLVCAMEDAKKEKLTIHVYDLPTCKKVGEVPSAPYQKERPFVCITGWQGGVCVYLSSVGNDYIKEHFNLSTLRSEGTDVKLPAFSVLKTGKSEGVGFSNSLQLVKEETLSSGQGRRVTTVVLPGTFYRILTPGLIPFGGRVVVVDDCIKDAAKITLLNLKARSSHDIVKMREETNFMNHPNYAQFSDGVLRIQEGCQDVYCYDFNRPIQPFQPASAAPAAAAPQAPVERSLFDCILDFFSWLASCVRSCLGMEEQP
ncbi:MAG: F-box protein [Chlamydiales bacterium]|nr:F-box protein [Chlamydiales bacterium]